MTSETNDATVNKTSGFNADKPVTVELNDQVIEANHHITNARGTLLHMYLNDRSDGIDVSVPLCSDKPAYARSDAGREALGLVTDMGGDYRTRTFGAGDPPVFGDDDSDDGQTIVTDGGVREGIPVRGVCDKVSVGDVDEGEYHAGCVKAARNGGDE